MPLKRREREQNNRIINCPQRTFCVVSLNAMKSCGMVGKTDMSNSV